MQSGDISGIGINNGKRYIKYIYDPESKFYYANGSYYDPSTGMYLDAAPVSAVIDNAFNLCSLDRNAPVCDNILELAGNPFTVATATNLSPDPNYYFKDGWPWWVKVDNWIKQAIYDAVKWYKKQHWAVRLGIGTALLISAVVLTAMTAGYAAEMYAMVSQLMLGIGFGLGTYLAGALLSGEFSWEGLGNAVLDAFVATSAILFIESVFSLIKCMARSKAVSTAG